MQSKAKSLLDKADSYFDKGNPEKALACYYLVRRLDNDNSTLQVLCLRIARTHAALKQYEKAIDAYAETVKYTPPDGVANVYVQIARSYESSGNNKEAVRYFRRALDQSPGPDFVGDVLYWLGESLYKVPEIDEDNDSLKTLERAKSEKRSLVLTWEIHNTKGHALTQKGQYSEALKEFENALSEDSDLIDIPGNILNNKASCLEALGRHEKAIQYYQKAIQSSRPQPDSKGFAHLRIGVLLEKSNPELAMSELENAKTLFETSRDAREIPEWYAERHLYTANKLIDDIHQTLGVAEMKKKQLPPIQFIGPVGVGLNTGTISQVNQTIGELAGGGSEQAASAIKELVEAIGNSKYLDDSQKNEHIETIEEIGRELQKPDEARDRSKKFTLEGIKAALDKVVDVGEVAAKTIKILLSFF